MAKQVQVYEESPIAALAAVVAPNKKADKRTRISPGTPEMEAYLAVGYPGMTVEVAETIISERKQNPASWPLERVELAKAYLAAYRGSPVAIDPSPGFNQGKRNEEDD